MEFYDLTPEELCDLMCGEPEEEELTMDEEMKKLQALEDDITYSNLPNIKDFETIMQDLILTERAHTRMFAFCLEQIAEIKAELEKIEGWRL